MDPPDSFLPHLHENLVQQRINSMNLSIWSFLLKHFDPCAMQQGTIYVFLRGSLVLVEWKSLINLRSSMSVAQFFVINVCHVHFSAMCHIPSFIQQRLLTVC